MHVPIERMAVLAIDLQWGFCHPEGSVARRGRNPAPLMAAARRSAELARRARDAGLPIIWTQMTLRPDYRDGGLLTSTFRPGIREGGGLKRGERDSALLPDLDLQPADFVVDKQRISAFYSSALEGVLRALKVEGLLVCGVTTAQCVETTVRDAFQRDYAAFVVEDCVAEYSPERHRHALSAMAYGFANVISWDDAVHGLDARAFTFKPGTD
ncbi:MAG: cysteine hydrolase [Alphaproteobacteria bacterium]|nr:cysteine hydrolase [Alphaproteobacteria bacterium]